MAKEGDTVGLFGELMNNIAWRQARFGVLGVEDAEAQIAVQSWLNLPATQNYLQGMKWETSQSIELVWNVREDEFGQTHVECIHSSGLKTGFFYDPKMESMRNAPNGFKVGDLILFKNSQGTRIDSARPIEINPDLHRTTALKFLRAAKKVYPAWVPDDFEKLLSSEE